MLQIAGILWPSLSVLNLVVQNYIANTEDLKCPKWKDSYTDLNIYIYYYTRNPFDIEASSKEKKKSPTALKITKQLLLRKLYPKVLDRKMEGRLAQEVLFLNLKKNQKPAPLLMQTIKQN